MQKIAVVTGSTRTPASPLPTSGVSRILVTATSYLVYTPTEIAPNPLDTTNYATQVAADEANTTANLGSIPTATSWNDIGVNNNSVTVAGTSWEIQCPNRPACIQQASNDSTLFRFTCQPGDVWVNDAATKERCEFRRSTNFSYTTNYQLDYLLYIGAPGSPSTTITDSNNGWIIIGQIHGEPDAGDSQGLSPCWNREVDFHRPHVIKHRTSTTDPLLSDASSVQDFSNSAASYGSWVRVREQHRIDNSGGTGYHKVWYDGVQVANYTGNTGYNDVVGPYYKIGIYRYADPDRTQVVMIQGMTIT